MKLLEQRKLNNATNDSMRHILKELNSKYSPLYELKWQSRIEDVQSKHSLVIVAKAQKVEHSHRMEKERIENMALQRQKHKDLQAEIEKRSRIFEQQKELKIAEQLRLREIKLSAQFKLNGMDDINGYGTSYDVGQINIVAEKTIHRKYKDINE